MILHVSAAANSDSVPATASLWILFMSLLLLLFLQDLIQHSDSPLPFSQASPQRAQLPRRLLRLRPTERMRPREKEEGGDREQGGAAGEGGGEDQGQGRIEKNSFKSV